MDVILVPGFWLNAASWAEVTPPLAAAGHRVHPLTLPGMGSADDTRSGVTLADHVAAVVDAIDAHDDPVVLVGHSGGGAIMYAAMDARPERVARAVYVDSGPLADGGSVFDGPPPDADDIPLLLWDQFEAEDLVDLTDELRARFRAMSVPEPALVAHGVQRLSTGEARLDIPATVIACEFPSSALTQMMENGHPYVTELGRARSVEFVDLPTGHWPQFTRPEELGAILLAAVERSGSSPGPVTS